jgi:hypothetical protein
MGGVTYDTGALVAAERNDRQMWALHAGYLAEEVIPTVPTPVLAEAWRGGSRQASLSRLLRMCDTEPMSEELARNVGVLVGKSGHADIVDVCVVEGAIRRGDAVVTSKVTHIRKVAEAVGARPRIESRLAHRDPAGVSAESSSPDQLGRTFEDRFEVVELADLALQLPGDRRRHELHEPGRFEVEAEPDPGRPVRVPPSIKPFAACAVLADHALPAMPRKTTRARLSRRTLASSSAPTFVPSLDRRTVVTLSTMIRLGPSRPLPWSGSISSRNNGASVGSVVNGHNVTESVSK